MARVYSPENSPEENLNIFSETRYPGRVLIMGVVGNLALQAYGITGRSEPSQNRRLVEVEEGVIRTEVFDHSKETGDPSLTIYNALNSAQSTHIISNGNQTSTAINYLQEGRAFKDAMEDSTYEPDSLATARISGFIDTSPKKDQPAMGLSLIRKDRSKENGDDTIRDFYSEYSGEIHMESGTGYALHTYTGEHKNPAPFEERPFVIPIPDNLQDMAEMLWDKLDPEFRVSVAAKSINMQPGRILDTYIINRHNK